MIEQYTPLPKVIKIFFCPTLIIHQWYKSVWSFHGICCISLYVNIRLSTLTTMVLDKTTICWFTYLNISIRFACRLIKCCTFILESSIPLTLCNFESVNDFFGITMSNLYFKNFFSKSLDGSFCAPCELCMQYVVNLRQKTFL